MSLIKCSECGKEISDKAASCSNCGNPINNSNSSQIREGGYLGCPICKSKDLHSEQKGFSVGKALAGVALTGGIGILAGTIGSRDIIITCLRCGNRFKAGEAVTINSDSKFKDGKAVKLLSDIKIKEMNDKMILALKNNNRDAAILIYQESTNLDKNIANQYVSKLERENKINFDEAKEEDLIKRVKELLINGESYAAFILYQKETGLSHVNAANFVKGLNIAPNETSDNNQYKIPFSVKFTDFFLTAGWKVLIVIIVVVFFLMLLDSLK